MSFSILEVTLYKIHPKKPNKVYVGYMKKTQKL